MAKSGGFGMTVRKLVEGGAKPPATQPPKGDAVDAPPVSRPVRRTGPPAPRPWEGYPRLGARFAAAAGALGYVGALAGSVLPTQVVLRRLADGHWWVEAETGWAASAELVRAAGGRPFAGGGNRWAHVPLSGSPPTMPLSPLPAAGEVHLYGPAGVESFRLGDAPPVGLETLLMSSPFRSVPVQELTHVRVLLPGALSRWVARRALGAGLTVSIGAARRLPFGGERVEAGLVTVELVATKRGISRALLQALQALPSTRVARPVGRADQGLWVDVGHQPPVVAVQAAALVPAGEWWVLGSRTLGPWRVQSTGQALDATVLLTSPVVEEIQVRAGNRPRLPRPLPISLVKLPYGCPPWDGVLLDNLELNWLARFLVGRPLAERAVILPGPGVFLLLAPGGLLERVPFGVGLERIGPGGLFLAHGLALYPALPEAARQKVFQLKEGELTVLTEAGCWRFELGQQVPVWTLWAGTAPEVKAGLSARAEKLLTAARSLPEPEGSILPSLPLPEFALRPSVPTGTTVDRMQRLLQDALEAELRGDLLTAAGKLEQAGELERAGRLYERAAGKLG